MHKKPKTSNSNLIQEEVVSIIILNK